MTIHTHAQTLFKELTRGSIMHWLVHYTYSLMYLVIRKRMLTDPIFNLNKWESMLTFPLTIPSHLALDAKFSKNTYRESKWWELAPGNFFKICLNLSLASKLKIFVWKDFRLSLREHMITLLFMTDLRVRIVKNSVNHFPV